MATHVPMARVPFAPLDNPRLQHLASAKNRQNGIIASKSLLGDKSSMPFKPFVQSPKRSFELATFDDFDAENVDPVAKKSKSDSKPSPMFSLAPTKSVMPPPPTRLCTPYRANMSSPRAPSTAPAGRSPTKRKSSGIFKARRTSAPFTRIDPPFAAGSGCTLPFSLDAALSGTFSKSSSKSASLTLQETMPQNWFFDIHQDTPDEEAANLMEHSTLTLDLSSDDECTKELRDDRGKENTPPEGYDAPIASRSNAAASSASLREPVEIVRKKVVTDAMDDGQRSPLSDLETDPFIPAGLDKTSHVIVNATPEKTKLDVNNLFATPVPFTAGNDKSSTTVLDVPVVNAEGEIKGDILVWEDTPEKSTL